MLGYINGPPPRIRDETRPQPGLSPRAKRLLAALLALLLLALLAWWWSQPRSIGDVALVGPRGPACERFVLANDVSGSMQEFAEHRQRAVAEFLSWAPKNLRPDDELGVIDFASDARWARHPESVMTGDSPAAQSLGGGTDVAPLDRELAQLPPSPCDTSLLFLSDAHIQGLPANVGDGRAWLRRLRVHDIVLLVPAGGIDVNTGWVDAFPEAMPATFDGSDSGEAGLAFARTFAHLTGQELSSRAPTLPLSAADGLPR